MATTDKNILKNWFLTGKRPTQAQFHAWMESFWHKDEKIPQSSIDNLETVLNAKAEKDQFDAHLTDPAAHPGKEDKSNKVSEIIGHETDEVSYTSAKAVYDSGVYFLNFGKAYADTKVPLANVQNNLNHDGTGRMIPNVDAVNNGLIQIGGFRDKYAFNANATGYADPGTGNFGFQNGNTFDNTYLLLNYTNLLGDYKNEYLSNLKNGAIVTITNTDDGSIVKKGVLFSKDVSTSWVRYRLALFLDKGTFLDGDNFSFTFEGRYYTAVTVPQEMSTAIFTVRSGNAYSINGQNGSTTIKFTNFPANAYITEISYSTTNATIPKFDVDTVEGMILSISNFSSEKLLLKHNSATGYFNMIFPNGKDFYLLPNSTIQFMFGNDKFYFIGPMNVPIELAAGTTTVPPLIIPRGELTTIPVEGALERDLNGNLYETRGGVRYQISATGNP